MLAACEFYLGSPREIIVAGERRGADTEALLRTVHARFLPNRVTLLIDSAETARALSARTPEIRSMRALDGRAAAYVCRDFACRLPVSEAAELAELLQ